MAGASSWLVLSATLVSAACADNTGCSTEAPIGQTLLTSPGDSLFKATAPDTFIARFQTSRGDFFVQVVREWATKLAAGDWRREHAPERLLRWVELYHRWRRR